MPAVPPRLAEAPQQLQHILFCGETYVPRVLFAFVGLCCVWLLWTRKAASRAAALRAVNEGGAFEQNEKRGEQEPEVAWLAAGQPTSAAHPMYASASEPPIIGGQRFDGAEIYPLPIRRTSYTKQFGDVSMQGEIMFGDGWTRHTRVYGGGVCLACEDSKKKQKMIMNSQGRPGSLSSPIG